CEAWATKAPERVAPRPVERAWLTAVERSGLGGEQLLSAVLAAVGRDPDFGRGKAMNLDRWLDEGRYEAWPSSEPAAAPAAGSAIWAGPAEVATTVAAAMGPAAVASYLNRAGWDGGRSVISAATTVAAERLRDGAGSALRAIGVRVEHGISGSAQHG